jgi:hypothetical protein
MEKRKSHEVLVGKPEGKISLARRKRRWQGNFKMELKARGWDGVG